MAASSRLRLDRNAVRVMYGPTEQCHKMAGLDGIFPVRKKCRLSSPYIALSVFFGMEGAYDKVRTLLSNPEKTVVIFFSKRIT